MKKVVLYVILVILLIIVLFLLFFRFYYFNLFKSLNNTKWQSFNHETFYAASEFSDFEDNYNSDILTIFDDRVTICKSDIDYCYNYKYKINKGRYYLYNDSNTDMKNVFFYEKNNIIYFEQHHYDNYKDYDVYSFKKLD